MAATLPDLFKAVNRSFTQPSITAQMQYELKRQGKSVFNADVNDELNRRHNTKYTVQNLSNKLARESLQYREAVEIAEIIGFEIEWRPKRS